MKRFRLGTLILVVFGLLGMGHDWNEEDEEEEDEEVEDELDQEPDR